VDQQNQGSSTQIQVQTVVKLKEPKKQQNNPNQKETQGLQVLNSMSIVQVVEVV
jgi:hypothetical protein